MKIGEALDGLKAGSLKTSSRAVYTQKVKSRVQATRLQRLKYVEGTSDSTGKATSS